MITTNSWNHTLREKFEKWSVAYPNEAVLFTHMLGDLQNDGFAVGETTRSYLKIKISDVEICRVAFEKAHKGAPHLYVDHAAKKIATAGQTSVSPDQKQRYACLHSFYSNLCYAAGLIPTMNADLEGTRGIDLLSLLSTNALFCELIKFKACVQSA